MINPRRAICFCLLVVFVISGGVYYAREVANAFIAEGAPKSKAAAADKTAPSISNVSVTPTSGAVGAKFKIKAKVTDSGGIKRVYARIRDANNNILTNINLYDDGKHGDGSANDGTFARTWVSSNATAGTYTIGVRATDKSNNTAASSKITITITAASSCADALTLANQVSVTNMTNDLKYLVQKSRVTGSAWNKTTADWLKSQMTSYGLSNVKEESGNKDGVAVINVVGELGSGTKTITIGAHRDSVAAAPGAVDNAAGDASILEMARILASCKSAIKTYKLSFVFFDAEETDGSYPGSEAYLAAHSGDNIQRMFNFDCYGWNGAKTLDVYQNASDLNASAKKACSALSLPCKYYGGASDDWSDQATFHAAGITYIYPNEDCGDSINHTAKDNMSAISGTTLVWGAKLGTYVAADMYLK